MSKTLKINIPEVDGDIVISVRAIKPLHPIIKQEAIISDVANSVAYKTYTTFFKKVNISDGIVIPGLKSNMIVQGMCKGGNHIFVSAYDYTKTEYSCVYMINASTKTLDEDIKIYNSINSDAPRIVVLNKIDLIKAEEAKEKKEIISENMKSALLIEASIKENFGLKEIKDGLYSYLEEGEPFYPTNIITDKDKAYQAKEIIRGKLLHFLRQEIPHQCAVVISSFKENDDKIEISAKIVTEKESQKGIIIGKGGNMIKSIKTAAKKEMETSWHKNVASLKIEVEADPGWRDSIKKLIEYGYGE